MENNGQNPQNNQPTAEPINSQAPFVTVNQTKPDFSQENTPDYPENKRESGFAWPRLIWLIIVLAIVAGIWYVSRQDVTPDVKNDNDSLEIKVSDQPKDGIIKIIEEKNEVVLTADSQNEIVAYYPNSQLGSTNDCGAVFPIKRQSPNKFGSAEVDTLIGLLTPLDNNSLVAGYSSALPAGTRLIDLKISGSQATANFSSELNLLAGSCAVSSARAQIEQTLKQFPYITSVNICVVGECQAVLQP